VTTKRLYLVFIAALILELPARASDESRSYYVGTVGKSAVQMQLVIETGSGWASGTYYYEKFGMPLPLRGDLSRDDAITLDEIVGKNVKNGTFKGQFTKSRQIIEGTWSSADQKTIFPFKLSKVAEYVLREAKEERCWYDTSKDIKGNPFTEEGACSFSLAYPRFLSTSQALHQINTIIETRAMRDYNDFVSPKRNGKEFTKEQNAKKGSERYDNYHYSIAYYTDDLVSLLLSKDNFAGGAHDLYSFESFTFSIKGGKAVPVNLTDLFIPDAPYLEVLSNILFRDATKLVDEDMKGFAITPAGIEFTFGESLGHSRSGSSEIVPYNALAKIIRPDGPLRRFVPRAGQDAGPR